MKVRKKSSPSKSSQTRIVAADERNSFRDRDFGGHGIGETLDDLADDMEDIQDTIDDTLDDIDEEDPVDIEMDNNISNHYIAECDNCHGVFISALIESDQEVESISGVCPLCNKETDQYIKWIVKDI